EYRLLLQQYRGNVHRMTWRDFCLNDSQLKDIIQNEVGSQMLLSRKIPEAETNTPSLKIKWATGFDWVISEEEDIDWDLEFENQVASNKLWLYSLVAVGRLSLDASLNSRKHFWAEKIVRSFISRSRDANFVKQLKTA